MPGRRKRRRKGRRQREVRQGALGAAGREEASHGAQRSTWRSGQQRGAGAKGAGKAPGSGGPGGGGPGGGGPRGGMNPMQFDKNGDGKLTKEERRNRCRRSSIGWTPTATGWWTKRTWRNSGAAWNRAVARVARGEAVHRHPLSSPLTGRNVSTTHQLIHVGIATCFDASS